MGIKKKIKRYLHNYKINKKYGKFQSNKIIKTEWNKFFINRIALINAAVSNILKKNNECNYMEIGCDDNFVFNSIILPEKNKIGIDPKNGGNYKMTSDKFFEKNKKKFDVIFIDGLHHYDQCQKDCINSMKLLNPGGIIFLHDLLPRCEIEQVIPQSYSTWSGDVWKVAVELSHSTNVDFKICNIDHGLGILKLKNDFEYKKLDLKNATFDEYLSFKKDFNIINSEDALDFIEFEN
mgnify:CR=1 FL=1